MSEFRVTTLPEDEQDATLPVVLNITEEKADELCEALQNIAGGNLAVAINSIHLVTEDWNERAFLYVFIGTLVGSQNGPVKEEAPNPVDNHVGG